MDWTEFILYGLLGVVIGTAVSIALSFLVASRRRCRECGRARALQRAPGSRREGFVRFRCRYCGAKQWGVIQPKNEYGPTAGL